MKRKASISIICLLLLFAGLASANEIMQATGSWGHRKDVHHLTGKVSFSAMLLSNETLRLTAQQGGARGGEIIALRLECEGDKWRLIIFWDGYLDPKSAIEYRFDDESTKEEFGLVRGSQFIFDRTNDGIEDFIIMLLNSESLEIYLCPWRKEKQLATFDVRGLEKLLSPHLADLNLKKVEAILKKQ